MFLFHTRNNKSSNFSDHKFVRFTMRYCRVPQSKYKRLLFSLQGTVWWWCVQSWTLSMIRLLWPPTKCAESNPNLPQNSPKYNAEIGTPWLWPSEKGSAQKNVEHDGRKPPLGDVNGWILQRLLQRKLSPSQSQTKAHANAREVRGLSKGARSWPCLIRSLASL